MILSTVPTTPRSAPAVGAAAAVRVDAARRRPAIGPDADLIVFARGALPTATASSVEVPAEIAICDDNRNGRTSGAERAVTRRRRLNGQARRTDCDEGDQSLSR